MKTPQNFSRFQPHLEGAGFPSTADTLLLDRYLTYEDAASARVFRVYRETPPHYHANSDEYLYVLSGRGTFWMGESSNTQEFAPGDLLFFRRGVMHALPTILEHPLTFLAIDTPRRDPMDILFAVPGDETPESFIRRDD